MDHIQQVTWESIQESIAKLIEIWEPPEAIVGISRGGVPIAIALCNRAPEIPIGYLYRVAARGSTEPFYVFNDDRLSREKKHEQELRLTLLPGNPKSILVVDDVATHGGTLEVCRKLIATSYPQAHIRYYCYGVDRQRLNEIRPSISDCTTSYMEIDNSKVWLKFPWQ